jgi:hypothetical protein
MILRSTALLTAALLSLVHADVEVQLPKAGDTITGTQLEIQWQDSGNSPALTDLASYQLFLCAGGNTESSYIQLSTLVTNGDFANGDSITVPISLTLGAPTKNAYFLKFISAATGGTIVNFSDRFTLSGMTGVFPAAVAAGVADISGTSGPPTQNNIVAPQAGGAGGAAPADTGAYATPYTMQTGSIRYAPMPPSAQSTITAKNANRQWPTSAYTIYLTNAGAPNAITTNTLPVTNQVSSVENTVRIKIFLVELALTNFTGCCCWTAE